MTRRTNRDLAPRVAKLALRALGALGTVGVELCTSGATPTLAADLPSAHQDSDCAVLDDCRLSLLARQALFSEPTLADLPLGVSVHANQARLWGTVPTAALVALAQERVRNVAGVAEVRNEIHVDPKVDGPREGKHAIASEPGRQPIIAQLADKPSPSFGAMAQPTLRALSGPIVIMPPISLTSGQQAASAANTELAEPTAVAPRSELKVAVDRLRRQDPALHGIQAQVDGRIVMLTGKVSSWENLLELARSISRLPGVERVILDKINTSSTHSLSMP